MTAASAPICFVDSNILIYAFASDDPHRSTTAQAVIRRLTETATLRVSTQVLQETFQVLTRKIGTPLTPSQALNYLDALSLRSVVVIDYPLIREAAAATDSIRISFWDSLILHAARRAGASIVYTEDLNHGQQLLGLTILNPFRLDAS